MHPAITRIALALSWINAIDIPEDEMERSASCAQELSDIRWIYDRVRDLKRSSSDRNINHWTTARSEFIQRVLNDAGMVLPNVQALAPSMAQSEPENSEKNSEAIGGCQQRPCSPSSEII